MTRDLFIELLEKFHRRQLTIDEIDSFLDAAASPEFESLITDKLLIELHNYETVANVGVVRESKLWHKIQMATSQAVFERQMDDNTMESAGSKQVISVGKVHFLKTHLFKYAAAIVVIIAGAFTYFYTNQSDLNKQVLEQSAKQALTAPEGEMPVLTLADGSMLVLDAAATDALARKGNTGVIMIDAGTIAYNVAVGASTQVEGFNTLTTPRGKLFKISLPDGTNVWLNSASSLQYPTSFSGQSREVYLKGEGYFEVAENAQQPFVVKSNKVEVQVLGTGFNLMAYDDEENIKTSLVNGAVKVKSNNSVVALKPGQEAVVLNNDKETNGSVTAANNSAIAVKEANLEEVLAWKDGKFRFDGAKISAIMRQVARWYDVSIEYDGPISTNEFYGVLPRADNAIELLDALEILGNVHFKIEGKKIIVKSGPRDKV